jgi:hypothetical protein
MVEPVVSSLEGNAGLVGRVVMETSLNLHAIEQYLDNLDGVIGK